MVGSATKNVGPLTLLHMIREYFPSSEESKASPGVRPDTLEPISRKYSDAEPFSAFVFKTVVDPFMGPINYLHVKSGTIRKDQEVFVSNSNEVEKIGQIFLIVGKNQLPVEAVHAGDICAIAKMNKVLTGSTLSEKKNPIVFEKPIVPTPTMYVAIQIGRAHV